MTAPVDIGNRALSEIGARVMISSMDENTVAAANCKLWYNTMRQMLLRGAHWGFARATAPLSLLGTLEDGTSQYPWRFMYAYPADCLKVRYLVVHPDTSDAGSAPAVGDTLFQNWNAMPSRNNRFLVANQPVTSDIGGVTSSAGKIRVILSNVPNAWAVYTCDETDCDIFDPLFENALIMGLASKLVIPLSGNAGMKASYVQLAQDALIQARVADGNESVPSVDHTPDWIATRGWPSYADAGIAGTPMLGTWFNSWDNVSWGE